MKVIYHDGHVAECPAEQELEVIRHSAAHILAQAVKRLYPQAHFAYGPATEKGFRIIQTDWTLHCCQYLREKGYQW